MKTILSFASSVALVSLLLPARAQTTPAATVPHNPTPTQAKAIGAKTADRRAEAYQGPKVVPDSKKLGQKMLRDSKPADGVKTRVQLLKK